MTPEQYEQAHDLFHAVRQAPVAERADLIRRSSADPVVIARVQAMLEHDHAESLVEAVQRSVRDLSVPEHVGPFRITGRLGEGGMGIVYRAEQSTPHRDVALKLVRPGVMSAAMHRRFEHEVDVLGQLSHPGIAQVFEAGSSVGTDGIEQPYFAMELVEGQDLLAYAASLDPQQRVALLVDICRAAQHAHQKGIIHRDLKPANILITAHGQPKILDFGVARGAWQDVSLTVTGQIVGTLGYMSPEQASGNHDAVDVRSDVHALGAIAYEIMTGRPAFDLGGMDLLDAARWLETHEPVPIGSLDPRLAGDLETIVAKAMAKEPEARYPSAAEFADDLRRYLDHEPVQARAPSAAYQLRKYARRNRRVIGTLSAVAGTLLVAVIISTLFGLRERTARREATEREAEANAARDEARKQANVALAVSQFLADDILAVATPESEPDRDLTLRTVLDRTAATIDGRFPDAPEVRATLHATVGDAYRGLAVHDQAEVHLREAVTSWESLGGTHGRAALGARHRLAMVLENRSRYDEAIALDEVTLERRRAALGNDDEDTIGTMLTLGSLYDSVERRDEAVELFDEALSRSRRHLGETHSLTLTALNNLAVLHYRAGRLPESIEHQEAALAIQRRTLGDDHPHTMTSINNLAAQLRIAGRRAEAWPLFEEAVARFRSVLGPEHTDTLIVQTSAALCLFELERLEEAETLYLETLAIQRRILGEEHLQTAGTLANLGLMYMDTERHEEAEPMLVEALRLRRALVGDDHARSRTTAYNLANLYLRTDRASKALPLFADTAERSRRTAPDHWLTGVHIGGHGECLAELGHEAEAEARLLEAHQHLERTVGAEHGRTRTARERLARWYETWGRETKAARWRPADS